MTVRDTPKDWITISREYRTIFIRHRGGFVGSDTSCVACHTVQANAPLGLVALTEENGEVFWTEEQSRQNFENVAMLVNQVTRNQQVCLHHSRRRLAVKDVEYFWNSTDHSEYRLVGWIGPRSNATADPVVDVDLNSSILRTTNLC